MKRYLLMKGCPEGMIERSLRLALRKHVWKTPFFHNSEKGFFFLSNSVKGGVLLQYPKSLKQWQSLKIVVFMISINNQFTFLF